MENFDPTRPQPVIDAAVLASKVTGLVAAVGAVLVLLGLTTTDEVNNWAEVLGGIVLTGSGLVGTVLPLVQARKAARQVTPLESPQDDLGRPLVPAGE